MNKPLFQVVLLILIIISFSCHQQIEKNVNKLTAINPLSYTGVIFKSIRDTVFVSTYSGRIAQRINNESSEHVIANINDEIYALAYSKTRNEIIAATLSSGILIINAHTGKRVKEIPLNDSWAIRIALTPDENYLFTTDLTGKNHVWDVDNDYNEIQLSEEVTRKLLLLSDSVGNLYFSSRDTTYLWNSSMKKIENNFFTRGNRLVDVDDNGNLLLLNYNECLFFNIASDSITYKFSHPNWIYLNPKGEVLGEIPLSMQLTRAKFANNRIYTAGIDRSIRVWDKITGSLLDSWTGHAATISDMQLSIDKRQMVTVDLKGNIKFWELH